MLITGPRKASDCEMTSHVLRTFFFSWLWLSADMFSSCREAAESLWGERVERRLQMEGVLVELPVGDVSAEALRLQPLHGGECLDESGSQRLAQKFILFQRRDR